jgi:hypothetical protein
MSIEKIFQINELLSKLKHPDDLLKSQMPISEWTQYKANEYRNLTFNSILYILYNVMPDKIL